MISKLAYVHPDAKIGGNVTIEPFAYVAGDVVIGDDCWIGPGAVINDGARIGKGCKIHTGASIACLPQDLKFKGEYSTAEIGDYNDIRECVTIARGTASRGKTVLCALPGALRTSSAMGSYAPQTPCVLCAAKHPLCVCPAPQSLLSPH